MDMDMDMIVYNIWMNWYSTQSTRLDLPRPSAKSYYLKCVLLLPLLSLSSSLLLLLVVVVVVVLLLVVLLS